MQRPVAGRAGFLVLRFRKHAFEERTQQRTGRGERQQLAQRNPRAQFPAQLRVETRAGEHLLLRAAQERRAQEAARFLEGFVAGREFKDVQGGGDQRIGGERLAERYVEGPRRLLRA